METIIKALNELQKINEVYGLSNKAIEELMEEIDTAKVCTPIIGKFSSGKSALINTLLGYSRRLLKEDITPETAVPTEITYTPDEDSCCIIRNDGGCETITVSDYRKLEVDANTVTCIRLNLKNSFLEKISDVMLVDMPGFESGYEVHNRAIDNYLDRSLAYIIAFPADDMNVRSSVGNILKELCLHDMPICIAITKDDKRNEEFDATFENLKENLKRFIGNREPVYCITSSERKDAEELKEFLKKIQENSQEILANKFRNAVVSMMNTTENYLVATLKSSELSESELNEQEARLGKQLDTLNSQFEKEKNNFDLQILEYVEEIKADVRSALENEESSLVAMALQNQSINDRMNTVVRNAVTSSIKKRFIPKIEKYLNRVENCINGKTVGDVHISFHFSPEDVNKGLVSKTVAAVAALFIAGPVFGSIIAGVFALVDKIRGDKKREEQKNQIRHKLRSEVYPQVLEKIGTELEKAISEQLRLINTSIEDEIVTQRAALEKAMEDVRRKISDEQERKENLAVDIKADLERIRDLRDELTQQIS